MLHKLVDPSVAIASPPLPSDQFYAVDFCRKTEAELIAATFKKAPTIQREVKIKSEIGLTGHADMLASAQGTSLVLDWKFGRTPVERAESNLQLRAYGVLAQEHLLTPTVIVGIVQPRVESDRRVTLCQYTAQDINTAANEIKGIISRADAMDAPLNPSDAACKYCKARHFCPAVKNLVTELAVVHSSEVADPVTMADYLKKARIVAKVCESIEYHAKKLVLDGAVLPGFKLKEGARKRTVTDAGKAYAALSETLKPEAFASCCSVKVSALDEAYRAATGLKVKDAKAELETKLSAASCFETKQAEASLVEDKA